MKAGPLVNSSSGGRVGLRVLCRRLRLCAILVDSILLEVTVIVIVTVEGRKHDHWVRGFGGLGVRWEVCLGSLRIALVVGGGAFLLALPGSGEVEGVCDL